MIGKTDEIAVEGLEPFGFGVRINEENGFRDFTQLIPLNQFPRPEFLIAGATIKAVRRIEPYSLPPRPFETIISKSIVRLCLDGLISIFTTGRIGINATHEGASCIYILSR